ncbi:MAG: sugar transferase [Oscillospiraceae bacterium]
MQKFLKAFEKTLLSLSKFILIFTVFALFYLLYMEESPELLRGLEFMKLNRVSAIISMTFIVVCYIMMRIYGGFNLGKKRSREIILSNIMAVGITDFFTYIQLSIMEKMIMPPANLVAIFFAQTVAVIIIGKLSNNLYYYVNPPKKLLIIYGEEDKLFLLADKLKMYQNRFKVAKIMWYDAPQIRRSIREVDGVMLIDVPAEGKEFIIDYCYKRSKSIYSTPSISDIVISNSHHDLIDDISMLSYESQGLSLDQRFPKRLGVILLSSFALIFAAPILLAEAVAIKLEDGGPVFFKQERITIGGRKFNLLKFRTMIVNAEKKEGAVLAAKHDNRITKVGAFLRKTRLDELPQLLNIIKGDMSIVGPRPERPIIATEYVKDLPEFSYRLRVKAGLTGYAQILGKYNTSPKDKLILDLLYIEKYSLRLDLKIMFQTVIVCLTPEKTEGVAEKSSEKPTK